jgi:hypothetical protein
MRRVLSPPSIEPTLDELVAALDEAAKRTGDRRYRRAVRELLKPLPGQRSPATELALRERDEAIRDMATFFKGSRRDRCRQVQQKLLEYETTLWKRGDKLLEAMPVGYRQTPKAGAFAVLRSGQSVPGLKQLQRILRADFGT